MIDPRCGSAALQKFFTEAFDGTLVTDFWATYDSVCVGDNQKCLPHLLRELLKVDKHNDSVEWKTFGKQLRRLIRDGIRLRKRKDFTPDRYASRIKLIHRRLCKLADAAYHDAHAARLGSCISRYRDQLFTFLDTPGVPADNNHAERQIRKAAIIRKKQSVQPQRGRRCHAGRSDERLSHAETARFGPDADDRHGFEGLTSNRQTTLATRRKCCRALKCYQRFN